MTGERSSRPSWPARTQGRHLCGLHLTSPHGEPPGDDDEEGLSEADREGLEDWAAHQANGTVVHVQINSTRPHTLAFALNDSPAGLAAWLLDKYRSYSDCDGDVERSFTKDELLAQITTYWVTGTIASASRLYYERVQEGTGASPRPTRRGPDRLRDLPPRRQAGTTAVGRARVQHPTVGRDAQRGPLSRGWRSPNSWSPSCVPSSVVCAEPPSRWRRHALTTSPHSREPPIPKPNRDQPFAGGLEQNEPTADRAPWPAPTPTEPRNT